jgi:hypothetical protein
MMLAYIEPKNRCIDPRTVKCVKGGRVETTQSQIQIYAVSAPNLRLVAQNDIQQRTVDFDAAVVIN